MKISGIIRARNESAIIKDTLDHFSQYCNHGIYVYDDASTDDTLDIVKAHTNVKGVIENKDWDLNRTRAEYTTRQAILDLARNDNPDWVLYFDADERLDVDMKILDYYMRSPDVDAVFMRLFDAYITEDDLINCTLDGVDHPPTIPYNQRKWFGPEYRDIGMFFRVRPSLRYLHDDQRIASFIGNSISFGYVKHYGKAISIEQWESTCDYYIEHFPESYKKKWKARKGKAIHDKSDFGRELIKWHEKDEKGVLLNESTQKK